MCCIRLAENTARKKIAVLAPLHNFVELHLCSWGMYRQLIRNLLNIDISSTCPDNIVNFGLLTAEICWRVWGTPANFNGFHVLAALLHSTLIVSISQTLRRWTEGATYIWQGGHHVGHWPTFLVCFSFPYCYFLFGSVWQIKLALSFGAHINIVHRIVSYRILSSSITRLPREEAMLFTQAHRCRYRATVRHCSHTITATIAGFNIRTVRSIPHWELEVLHKLTRFDKIIWRQQLPHSKNTDYCTHVSVLLFM